MEKYFLKTKEMSIRKPLLFVLLCLFSSVALFAAKSVIVTVQSGDVSVLKKASIALLEINFADTMEISAMLTPRFGHTDPPLGIYIKERKT